MSVFQPLNVLQISLVVATESVVDAHADTEQVGIGRGATADGVERDRDVGACGSHTDADIIRR